MRRALFVLALALSLPAGAETITVGSKGFTESRLLAEMLAQLIEAKTDLVVERKLGLGGTALVFGALKTGEIDVYPEYTGTGWAVHLGRDEKATDPLRVYTEVASAFRADLGVEWLQPFGFNNTYVLAMREARAAELGVTRVSQLSEHTLSYGVSHEFLNRKDGFPGLKELYGLKGEARGMDHGLAYEALISGAVDAVDSYSTDGKLAKLKVRLLEDDRRYFPPYDCAPVVRVETLKKHPQLRGVLDGLAWRLDEATMARLNADAELGGGRFAEVAAAFLQAEGLSKGLANGTATAVVEDQGLLAFLWSRRDETLGHGLVHLALTAVSVVLACLFAIPVGILLSRRRRLAPLALGGAGILQTIPSLALLAFLIPVPFLGLGARSAVVALFLYALLPILRNTYTAIAETDALLVEAARGIGLSDGEILRYVELPLAVPTIMAGVRTATVISVGVATLAAFIGAGGLGEPIITGLQLNDTRLILSGALPAAGLAVIVDAGLGLVERRLRPKGL